MRRIPKIFLFFMMITTSIQTNAQVETLRKAFGKNKTIPAEIEQHVLTALSFYPELKDTPIIFNFKVHIKSSIMQAQPIFYSLLGRKKHRRYQININRHFKLVHTQMPIEEIPDEVMIGWIGHELGHILDYESMRNTEMISFGYKYVFDPAFVKHAEMVADSLAVERGMGNYIVATKRFILDHADLPQAYKDKISRLYLSPDVIVEQVRKLEEQKVSQ